LGNWVRVWKEEHPDVGAKDPGSVEWMCGKLKVSRASFYRWQRPTVPTPTQLRHEVLDAHVVRVYERDRGTAGRDQIASLWPRKASALPSARSGRSCVGAACVRCGCGRGRRPRPWTRTLGPSTAGTTGSMRTGNGTSSSAVPRTRLCGDITYLQSGSGWL